MDNNNEEDKMQNSSFEKSQENNENLDGVPGNFEEQHQDEIRDISSRTSIYVGRNIDVFKNAENTIASFYDKDGRYILHKNNIDTNNEPEVPSFIKSDFENPHFRDVLLNNIEMKGKTGAYISSGYIHTEHICKALKNTPSQLDTIERMKNGDVLLIKIGGDEIIAISKKNDVLRVLFIDIKNMGPVNKVFSKTFVDRETGKNLVDIGLIELSKIIVPYLRVGDEHGLYVAIEKLSKTLLNLKFSEFCEVLKTLNISTTGQEDQVGLYELYKEDVKKSYINASFRQSGRDVLGRYISEIQKEAEQYPEIAEKYIDKTYTLENFYVYLAESFYNLEELEEICSLLESEELEALNDVKRLRKDIVASLYKMRDKDSFETYSIQEKIKLLLRFTYFKTLLAQARGKSSITLPNGQKFKMRQTQLLTAKMASGVLSVDNTINEIPIGDVIHNLLGVLEIEMKKAGKQKKEALTQIDETLSIAETRKFTKKYLLSLLNEASGNPNFTSKRGTEKMLSSILKMVESDKKLKMVDCKLGKQLKQLRQDIAAYSNSQNIYVGDYSPDIFLPVTQAINDTQRSIELAKILFMLESKNDKEKETLVHKKIYNFALSLKNEIEFYHPKTPGFLTAKCQRTKKLSKYDIAAMNPERLTRKRFDIHNMGVINNEFGYAVIDNFFADLNKEIRTCFSQSNYQNHIALFRIDAGIIDVVYNPEFVSEEEVENFQKETFNDLTSRINAVKDKHKNMHLYNVMRNNLIEEEAFPGEAELQVGDIKLLEHNVVELSEEDFDKSIHKIFENSENIAYNNV